MKKIHAFPAKYSQMKKHVLSEKGMEREREWKGKGNGKGKGMENKHIMIITTCENIVCVFHSAYTNLW